MNKIKFKKTHGSVLNPVKATTLAACFDVHAFSPAVVGKGIIARVNPGNRVLIDTGLIFELPENIEIQVRPRSGWALKNGLTVLNSPGTIDPDFPESCKVILINHGSEPVFVRNGDRVAQFAFKEIIPVELEEAVEVETVESNRTSGLGSTGIGDLTEDAGELEIEEVNKETEPAPKGARAEKE